MNEILIPSRNNLTNGPLEESVGDDPVNCCNFRVGRFIPLDGPLQRQNVVDSLELGFGDFSTSRLVQQTEHQMRFAETC